MTSETRKIQKRRCDRARYPEIKDRVLRIKREQRAADPEKFRARDKQYREKYALMKKAHNAVTNALAAGTLVRGNCHCGAVGDSHHEDYSKPLEVTWLCTEHHRLLHRK